MDRDTSKDNGDGEMAGEAPLVSAPPEADRDVAQQIEEMSATEGAEVLEKLPRDLSAEVSEYLDPNTAAQVLAEMDPAQAATVIAGMEPPEASMVLSAMEPDDRVDILAHIPKPLHDQLLLEMPADEATETRQLEQYPRDSAGGIMTPQVTALDEDLTIGQAVEELRRLNESLEQMFYVYVVDKRGHLVGVLSMRDLIMSRPEKRLSQIMRSNVVSVPATMDQEEVARMFRDRNYLAMPVVDGKNRLLGIITVDDVVDVMQEEATEDVQRMFGVGAEERLTSPWHFSFRKRVGWLVVNLGTAFMAGFVVSMFDTTIYQLTVLAVYMPIVAGMGGNTSAQAMAVAIRGLATARVNRAILRHMMFREMAVGLLTGISIGSITALVAMLWQGKPMLGLVVGLALVINHTLASITGAGIPLLMKRLGFDPAQSATIFATTITDIAGFFSLLGLAYLFIKHLV
jgi:magnesium transporter